MKRFVEHRGFVRTHAWLMLVITALAVVGALFAATSRPSQYESKAVVIVLPERLPEGGLPQQPDMVTEKQVAMSGNVELRARGLLPSSAQSIGDGLSVTVPVDSNVLVIAFTATTAEAAHLGASIYTQAYVGYRNELATKAAGSSDLPPATEVITSAARPTGPVPVKYPLIIALSVVMGLGVALAAAFARDQLTGRLRDSGRVQELAGHPVLGIVSSTRAEKGHTAAISAGPVPGAEVYGQVAARFLQEAGGRSSATLLVTSAMSGDGTTQVATNVAIALATAGHETVLVRAAEQKPASGRTSKTTGIDVRHGEGTANADRVVSTEVPRLLLATVQVARTSESGSRPIPDLSQVLPQLAVNGRLVVVAGEPLLGRSLTAVIAHAVDATILVVDPRRDSVDDLASAGSVLATVGTIMGCVVYDSSGTSSQWRVPRPQIKSAPVTPGEGNAP